MSANLFRRLLRRNLVALGVYAFVLAGFEFFVVAMYPTFGTGQFGGLDMGRLLQMMPEAMRSFLGGKELALTGFLGWLSFGFTHPIVLFILAALPVTLAARAVAGEVGGGTGELLFTRPVTRRAVVLTNAVFLTSAQAVLGLAALAGIAAGRGLFAAEEAMDTAHLVYAVLDAVSVPLAFGFLTLAASAYVRTQGRALSIGAGATIFFYLYNVVADLWDKAAPYKKLGLFHYFEPGQILGGGGRPAVDLGIAFAVCALCLAAALWLVEKRDL